MTLILWIGIAALLVALFAAIAIAARNGSRLKAAEESLADHAEDRVELEGEKAKEALEDRVEEALVESSKKTEEIAKMIVEEARESAASSVEDQALELAELIGSKGPRGEA